MFYIWEALGKEKRERKREEEKTQELYAKAREIAQQEGIGLVHG